MKHILKTISFIFCITLFIFVCSCTESAPSTNKYTVTFKDYDGTILREEVIQEGHNATAPEDPIRDGYNFIGWDKEYTNILEETVVNALYKENEKINNKEQLSLWGFTLNITLDDSLNPVYNATNNSIEVDGSYEIFAPGIKRTISTIKVNCEPEVRMKMLPTVNFDLQNWIAGGKYYCPLSIIIGDTKLSGNDYITENDFEQAVKDAIEQAVKGNEEGIYNAGTTYLERIIIIELEWPFESSNDILDTELGNSMNDLKIELGISVTIVQLD